MSSDMMVEHNVRWQQRCIQLVTWKVAPYRDMMVLRLPAIQVSRSQKIWVEKQRKREWERHNWIGTAPELNKSDSV